MQGLEKVRHIVKALVCLCLSGGGGEDAHSSLQSRFTWMTHSPAAVTKINCFVVLDSFCNVIHSDIFSLARMMHALGNVTCHLLFKQDYC